MSGWKECVALILVVCSLVIANEPTLQHESIQIISTQAQTPLLHTHSVEFPRENGAHVVTHTHHYSWSGLSSPILKRATFVYQSGDSLAHFYIPDRSITRFGPAGVHVLLETDSPRSSSMLVSLLRDHVMSSMHIGSFSIPLIFDLVLQDEPAELKNAQWLLGEEQSLDNSGKHFFYFFRPLAEVPDPLVPVDIPSSFLVDGSDRKMTRISFHLADTEMEFSQQEVVQGSLVLRPSDQPQTLQPAVQLQYTLDEKEFLSTSLSLVQGEFSQKDLQVEDIHRRYSTLHSMQRSLSGEGHHRELLTTLSISTNDIPARSSCQATLVERLSNAFFVDQYQVDERRKFGGSTLVLLDHTIDLEKPSYQSSPNVVLSRVYWSSNGTSDPITLQFEMPIHTRYHKPASELEYEVSAILPPVVAVSCSAPDNVSNSVFRSLFTISLLFRV